MRIGVEVGGTFTDLVLFDHGQVRVTKVPSTPSAPDRGAMDAINAAQVDLSKTDDLVHGSTVATNAILERKGARVCLFVTEGTRDLLHIQRHDRRHIYDLYYRKPEPIVQRRDTFEIRERVDAAGHVVIGATEQEVEQTVRAALGSHTFGSVAICLLNSYANPDHERMVAAAVRRLHPNV
ncbi:MAG: N-methylhydantoinase A, partial [Gammaproteobacteria bacterium]